MRRPSPADASARVRPGSRARSGSTCHRRRATRWGSVAISSSGAAVGASGAALPFIGGAPGGPLRLPIGGRCRAALAARRSRAPDGRHRRSARRTHIARCLAPVAVAPLASSSPHTPLRYGPRSQGKARGKGKAGGKARPRAGSTTGTQDRATAGLSPPPGPGPGGPRRSTGPPRPPGGSRSGRRTAAPSPPPHAGPPRGRCRQCDILYRTTS